VDEPPPLDDELRAAIEAGRAAGDLIRASFAGPGGGGASIGGARRNGPHDVVTRLDTAAERLIRRILLGASPRSGFIGEETRPRSPVAGSAPPRTWIVDPIDGTVGFVSGLPFFSVSIALAIGDRVALGVVHDPVHGETFVGRDRAGAWLLTDSRPDERRELRIRRPASTADAVVSAYPGEPADGGASAAARLEDLRRRVRVLRTLGSTALSLAYLAAGRLDGVLQVEGLQAVDIAAGGLLALEAGAHVSDAAGGPWLDLTQPEHGRGIAAGGPAVHRYLLAH
jgi:myo-inositol-1(or 4)-monophosphatase